MKPMLTMTKRRRTNPKSFRYRRSTCLFLLFVLMLFVSFISAEDGGATPSPIRIPDTLPPSPAEPPPTTEAPIPTEAPPTTAPPTTRAPTAPAPTDAPTPLPTLSPTVSPTLPPSPSPSAAPTVSPTASPTVAPTVAPTVPPTLPPTARPSESPSISATSTPSNAPSPSPSLNPTALLEPTAVPTISAAPSTPLPSNAPSKMASNSPSNPPTVSPTTSPSSEPSSSPTLSMQESVVEVFVTFDNMPKLEGKSVITFRSITNEFIEVELMEEAEPPMTDLSVWTNVKNQAPISTQQQGNRRNARLLQPSKGDVDSDDEKSISVSTQQDGIPPRNVRVLQTTTGRVIVFDTTIEYRSIGTDHDVPALVGGTWDTQEDQDAFIAALKSTGDPTFQGITAMSTSIKGWEPSPEGGSATDLDLFIIIGASVGGAALLFLVLICFVYLRRRGRKHSKKRTQKSNVTFATPQPPIANGGERISTEIVVEHQDDVSTLGDPMFGAGGMLIPGLEKDETVAASSFGDYEYAKTYGANEGGAPNSVVTDSISKRTGMLESDRESSTALDLGQMEDPFFSDDSSFEEQYQDEEVQIKVLAPPGKLGMVIDTPSGGIPVVHAIKDTSVLAGEVKVGDRLLSVDGEDCTGLSAMQVSKLISQRAGNASRAFVFSRSRARLMSKDTV